MPNAGTSLNLASNQPDPAPHPQSLPELASNVTDVLRAAPIFSQAPAVAVAIAKQGGNVPDNAHAVAAVAHARALDKAAQNLMGQEAAREFQAPSSGGLLGSIGRDLGGAAEAAGRGVVRGTDAAGGAASSAESAIGKASETAGQGIITGAKFVGEEASKGPTVLEQAVTGTGPNDKTSGGGSMSPGMVQLSQGLQQQSGNIVNSLTQQVNPLALMQTPQHLYRTWVDIEAKHGPAAMVEAMIPSLVGAGGAYFLTHSPQESEEAGAAAADLTAGEAPDIAGGANAAQRSGQLARKIVTTAAKPITVPAGATMRAAVSVGSSPTFLGANVGGIATQLDKSFKQSWDATANGSPRGEIGSFGRLVATGLADTGLPGLEKGSMAFNAISGGLDAFSQIAVLDPLGAAGRVVGQARSAEGFSGPLGKFWGGTAIQTPADIDRIAKQYPAADHFLQDVPHLNAGQILQKYGMHGVNGPMAVRLGQASTYEEAKNVMQDSARSIELATTTGKMPTLTAYTKVKSALSDSKLGVYKLTTPLPTMYDEDLQKFTGREFTAGDPNAVGSIMHLLRATGERPNVVTDIGTMLLETSDPRRWANILSNISQVAIQRQVLKAIGNTPLSDAMAQSINQAAEQLFGGRGAGFEGEFGRAPEGKDLSTVMPPADDPNQVSRAAALNDKQLGKMVMPTVRDVQKVSKDIARAVDAMSGPKVLYAKGQNVRDFLDDTVNHKFFQPLALATGGWALRVSSSEMLLNTLRLGPLNYSAAAIARSAAKHDLAIGLIQTDPSVLADMDKADKLAEKAIQSSTASNAATRATVNLTRNIVAVTRGILAGTDAALLKGLGKERFLDAATKLVILHDGYMIPGGISSTHNLPVVGQDEVSKKESDILLHQQRFNSDRKIKNVTMSSDYGTLKPSESGYFSALSSHQGLISSANVGMGQPLAAFYRDQLEAGKTEAEASAASITWLRGELANMDPGERAYYLRDKGMSPDSTTDPHTDWAVNSVLGLRGAISGQYEGTLNREMLNDIADGTVPPTAKQMMEKYADPKSPHFVPTHELPRNVPGAMPQMNGSQVLQRAASYMHTRVFSKVVNYLSREPTFIADFANESKTLEKQVADGSITQDQSDVIAQTRAVFKSIRFVHNPQDRMAIEQNLHVIAPFYFAKNQAIRRAGRLLASNPGAFEQYLKLNLAVQNISFQANQANGSSSFVFPGSAIVGNAMTGLMGKLGLGPTGSIPVSLAGSTDAMQTMVPWSGNGESAPGSTQSIANTLLNPSLGPLGAIPVKAVADFTSGFASDDAKAVLGPIGSSTAWWTYLFPNSGLQHIVEAGLFRLGSQSAGTSTNSALLQAIAAVAEEQGGTRSLVQIQPSDISGKNVDPSAAEISAPDQAKLIKQIVNMTALNLLGRAFVSYLSPVSVTLQRADLKISNEVQTYITAAKGNISTGIDNFMKDHPDAVASTVYESTSNVGSGYGDTAKVGQWLKDNAGIVSKYPNAAQWIIPPTDNVGPYAQSTHTLQIAEGLRHENTPQEFLNNVYISSGNAWYFNNVKPQLDAALKAAPYDKYNIYATFDKYVTNYGLRNPTWLTYWQGEASTVQRQQSLNGPHGLIALLADPATPKNLQTERLSALVKGYQTYLGEKTNAPSAEQRATLKVNWQAQMAATAKAWPDVAPAVTDLFSHLS